MKKASWLVEYAKGQIGRGYWFGTFGQKASASLLASKRNQYPSYYDQAKYSVKFTDQFGEKVHDCAGLIKGALWCDSIDGSPKYNASQDVGANTMINQCTVTGSMSSLPEIPGLLLWKSGHIGVYIGGGYAVEAKGHDYGVQKTKVSGRGWTKWGKCKWFDYSEPAPTPDPRGYQGEFPTRPSRGYFQRYDRGPEVVKLQKLLEWLVPGCLPKYGCDGDIGSETLGAVMDAQKLLGVKVDGFYGKDTEKAAKAYRR